MRILILCHEYPPIGGGAAAVVAALAKEYRRRENDVVVVTMGFGDLVSHESAEGIVLHRVPCSRRRKEMASPLEGLYWAARCLPLVRSLHEERPFDAVHAHFIMPAGIVADCFRRSCGVSFIVTPHGSDVPGYNRERLRAVHHLVRPWWRRICRNAARVTSPSHSLLALIERSAGECKGQVVPNGLETGRFPERPKEKRILLCSRLVERKGFHVFLEAIQDLDLQGWEIDLVGDGPMRARLEQLADLCRIPVHMHGWIDNDDPRLAALYARALVFVFPSEWENFSIALLEAMDAECAVITTDIEGNREVVGDTGLLVTPGDRDSMRSALVRIVDSFDECRELGRRAGRRVRENFDWRLIGHTYLKLLTDPGGDEESA